jgi:hypothetical protein
VREHGFQMHHYRGCAGDPLMSWRCEAAFFAAVYRPETWLTNVRRHH